MKLLRIDNYSIRPSEIGYVMTDPTDTTRPTVILVQGVEIRVRTPKAEVEKLLEASDG